MMIVIVIDIINAILIVSVIVIVAIMMHVLNLVPPCEFANHVAA